MIALKEHRGKLRKHVLRAAVVHPAGIVFGLFQDFAPVFPIAAVYISKQAVMGKGGMMRAELILITADQVFDVLHILHVPIPDRRHHEAGITQVVRTVWIIDQPQDIVDVQRRIARRDHLGQSHLILAAHLIGMFIQFLCDISCDRFHCCSSILSFLL